MQILVLACDNNPPDINAIEEVCLVAGETLRLPIDISDPDFGQLVKVTASGGPFEIDGNMAILEAGPGGFQEQPFQATLIWTPQCEQIREHLILSLKPLIPFIFHRLVDHFCIQ